MIDWISIKTSMIFHDWNQTPMAYGPSVLWLGLTLTRRQLWVRDRRHGVMRNIDMSDTSQLKRNGPWLRGCHAWCLWFARVSLRATSLVVHVLAATNLAWQGKQLAESHEVVENTGDFAPCQSKRVDMLLVVSHCDLYLVGSKPP